MEGSSSRLGRTIQSGPRVPTYSGKAGDCEPLLGSRIWLLLTSDVPAKEQVYTLTAEVHKYLEIPSPVVPLLNSLSKITRPMAQFSSRFNAIDGC
eukprot:9342249-Ditylum_brightwellii.AAC.1